MTRKSEADVKTDVKKNDFKNIKKLMNQLEKKERERVTIQAKLNKLDIDIPTIKKELLEALNEQVTEVKKDDKNIEINDFLS